jgi:hypothetical protein
MDEKRLERASTKRDRFGCRPMSRGAKKEAATAAGSAMKEESHGEPAAGRARDAKKRKKQKQGKC